MSNQKILELEATLKDTASLAENTTEITDLKKSLNRAVTRHEEESSRTKNQIDELQKRLDHAGKSYFFSERKTKSFVI
jgi:septal ring factor EnvC (AmiA/AmiB activator)